MAAFLGFVTRELRARPPPRRPKHVSAFGRFEDAVSRPGRALRMR